MAVLPRIQVSPFPLAAVPPPIDRLHDYAQWQTDHPTAPLPGDWVNDDIDQCTNQDNLLAARLDLIQRDDGALENESVRTETLHPEVLALLEDAQSTATQAAIDAAADAAQAAADAATSANAASLSAVSAASSAANAANAAIYEAGAIAAQTAAEAAQAAAEGAAAQMPPPPLTPGKGLIVNGAATNYVLQDVMTEVAGAWDGMGKVLSDIAPAVLATDVPNLTQVQGLISGAGAVPPPVAGDVDKALVATGANAFTWLAVTLARIADMSAFMRGVNALTTAALALAALGGVPLTRLISPGTGLTGGGDLSADRTLNLADTAVAPGAYTRANFTVDQQGRIVAAANGTVNEVPSPTLGQVGQWLKATATGVWDWAAITAADLSDATAYMRGLLTTINNAAALLANIGAVPTTRTISVTAPITGGGSLAADRSIGHANSGVAAGAYTSANITVDATGHVTAAANGNAAPAAATQAEMEAASSLTVFVSPGRQIYHPGMPKAVFWFDGSLAGTNAPAGGYGCTSVQRTAAGSYTCTLSTAMSSTNYGVLCTSQSSGATHDPATKTTTTFRVFNVNAAGAFADTPLFTVAVYGDQ